MGERLRLVSRTARLLGAMLLVGVLAGPAGAGAGAATPAQAEEVEEVEDHFLADGPSPVTTTTGTDGSGATYTIFHPTDIATDGVDNPIVTYGNGSGASCTNGNPTQGHLASWGFVVVCADSGQTGWGTEIWAGAQYMVAQDANPSSPFHGQLDTANVGAIGHSQGATGAVNATVLSDGVITSTVALALVDPIFHFPASQLPAFGQVEDPIFFVSGASDFLTSQSSQQNYYGQVAGPAAKGALVGKDHNTMIEASLGYATAWFTYTLQGDTFARSAFVGSPPELTANPAWTNQATRNLP